MNSILDAHIDQKLCMRIYWNYLIDQWYEDPFCEYWLQELKRTENQLSHSK